MEGLLLFMVGLSIGSGTAVAFYCIIIRKAVNDQRDRVSKTYKVISEMEKYQDDIHLNINSMWNYYHKVEENIGKLRRAIGGY